jgi:hypothetical protein
MKRPSRPRHQSDFVCRLVRAALSSGILDQPAANALAALLRNGFAGFCYIPRNAPTWERNAMMMAARLQGTPCKEVAQRFGLTREHVSRCTRPIIGLRKSVADRLDVKHK